MKWNSYHNFHCMFVQDYGEQQLHHVATSQIMNVKQKCQYLKNIPTGFEILTEVTSSF